MTPLPRIAWLARTIIFIFIIPFCSLLAAAPARADSPNLIHNPDFKILASPSPGPANYRLTGDVEYRYLGDPRRDASGMGVALESARYDGSVSQDVTGIDAGAGRWFRFTIRGLPQDNFAVGNDDLYMKVEFLGDGGRTSYDAKQKKIYPLVEQARRDFSVNGDHRVGGAAVWNTYELDFYLPFPQVDELRVSAGFSHGSARGAGASDFFIGNFSLVRIPDPALDPALEKLAATQPSPQRQPHDNLLPLGGRWYYDADPGQTEPVRKFDHANADRLLYHDALWQAPFAGNTSAWLRAGDKDLDGNVVAVDRLIADNVTVTFTDTTMIVHTHGIPNHPTGKFPERGFGNPNYITEQNSTYYIPLDPKVNPSHFVTTIDNSNHALPMGPIGIAANGVVFFNPFDMGNQDASSLMDRCCGHPNQDGLYHYHKYPICINSPWSDEGKDHSPLIGWAFDGFPIYGPYESKNVMAKDVTGANALNAFNLHWDSQRGWHYHVTPGQFPYIIGGYWGTEDPRDRQRPNHGARGGGPPFGGGNGQMGPPRGQGNGPPGPPPFDP